MTRDNQLFERNNYIDFLRGIAALGIVAIHTAFWGGQSYTPSWFQNATLLLDVPFFFYLSGWASSYRMCGVKRACKSLLGIWMKWVFFVTVLALFCWGSTTFPYHFDGVRDLRDLVQNYMFNVSMPGFCVVAGSIWFMPYYFLVIITNSIIMVNIQKSEQVKEHKITYMWLLLAGFIWVLFRRYSEGVDLLYFLFYSFFWMLGMNRYGRTKTTNSLCKTILCLLGATILMSYLQGLSIYDLQSAKFPPTLKYGFASLIMIVFCLHFDGQYKGKMKFIEHIGKNAIFYYFGQGIGSSINYYVVNSLDIGSWFIKWLITYVINVIITMIVAETLAFSYKWLISVGQLIKNTFKQRTSDN